MALFLFTKAILAGEPINVFNNGEMIRDFTYVDDIVEGVVRVVDQVPVADPNWDGNNPDPATSAAPYRVYNIGNSSPQNLMRYIEVLEENLGKTAVKNFMPMQPGDVRATQADTSRLSKDTNYKPETTIETGIRKFVEWYREFYES